LTYNHMALWTTPTKALVLYQYFFKVSPTGGRFRGGFAV
jgi:hypothetical protein